MLESIIRRLDPNREELAKLKVDLVDYYNKLYKEKVRPVDQNWVTKQMESLEEAYEYQNRFARFEVPWAMNSYLKDKPMDSKITFVLWKMNSGCECLRKCGYCFSKHSDDCSECPLHQAACIQLSEIEHGTDCPTGKTMRFTSREETIKVNGQLVMQNKKGKIQVYFTENSGKVPVQPKNEWGPSRKWNKEHDSI